jgi:hypothetical protein
MAKQKITGLWARSLRDGRIILSAKISLTKLEAMIAEARAKGLPEDVSLEIWPAGERATDRHPTHTLSLSEPYNPNQGAESGNPYRGGFAGQPSAMPKAEDVTSYPF